MTARQGAEAQHYADPGFVYVLTNAAMPSFVKIGLSRKDDLAERLRQLDTTSVAMPFECFYAARVPDCGKLERVLHRVFGDKRVRPNREFFSADPELAKLIIELVEIGERPVNDAEQGISPAQREEIETAKATRAPALNFERIGLAAGTVLTLTKDPNITCIVTGPKAVIFGGETMSPSKAALRALHGLGYTWSNVSGSEYWAFEGVKLSAISPQSQAGSAPRK